MNRFLGHTGCLVCSTLCEVNDGYYFLLLYSMNIKNQNESILSYAFQILKYLF